MSDTSCAFFNFFPMTWGLFWHYNNWYRLNHIPPKAVLKSSLSPLQWDLIWKQGHCRCNEDHTRVEQWSVSCSVVSDSATPGTVALKAPLSMEFSRKKYWSGSPFPSPGNLPNPRINPGLSHCRQNSLLSKPPGKAPAGVEYSSSRV